MVALRCTQKLLQRLKVREPSNPGEAKNALGHWYANILILNRRNYVLAMSERSCLCVLMPAAPYSTLVPRFTIALFELLLNLKVETRQIDKEMAAMESLSIARTANRRLLATLNQFAYGLDADFYYNPERTLLERELWLAGYITTLTGYRDPGEVAVGLLSAGRMQ
jgi:hypothetical protein